VHGKDENESLATLASHLFWGANTFVLPKPRTYNADYTPNYTLGFPLVNVRANLRKVQITLDLDDGATNDLKLIADLACKRLVLCVHSLSAVPRHVICQQDDDNTSQKNRRRHRTA